MKNLHPVSLFSACENLNIDFIGDPQIEINSVTLDSRQVESGGLFACLPGEHADGLDFVSEAIERGAVALLASESIIGIDETKITTALTSEPRRVLGEISAHVYGDPSLILKCYGVTGTNGKTTTVYLLSEIATAAGELAATLGTLGARFDSPSDIHSADLSSGLTTPEAPELQSQLSSMLAAGIETVALEVSSHSLAQFRVDGTHFKAACFTNLGHDHLDFHRSKEAYFEAKARLFNSNFIETAIVNIDDSAGVRLAEIAHAENLPTFTFGLRREAQFSATEIKYFSTGARFVLVDRANNESIEVKTNLLGPMNVLNALGAAATARAGGYSLIDIATGLGRAAAIPGRMESIPISNDFAVLVDYAHTPDALAAALIAARSVAAENRVLLVFGCGGERDFEKRSAMGEVAVSNADFVVVTSDNPRSEDPKKITDQIISTIDASKVELELDRRRAIRRALSEARTGDVVIVAGKGHETQQIIANEAVPFSDREVIQEELAAQQ